MSIDELAYSELQEITFWQKLNKQVMEFRDAGVPITGDDPKKFQKFCIENRIFHRISENPLIDDIPLSLITNFDEIAFLTNGRQKWNDALCSVFSNVLSLNIERALGEAFDEMTRLETEYDLIEETEEYDDSELFEVIDQYHELIEDYSLNFSHLSKELHGLKADSLTRIRDSSPEVDFVIDKENNHLLFNVENKYDKVKILNLYFDYFCKPANAMVRPIVSALAVFEDMNLVEFFDRIETRFHGNPAINEFIQQERNLHSEAIEFIRSFQRHIEDRLAQSSGFTINICNLNCFSFLTYPLPIV
jgi:hypothetical protein